MTISEKLGTFLGKTILYTALVLIIVAVLAVIVWFFSLMLPLLPIVFAIVIGLFIFRLLFG